VCSAGRRAEPRVGGDTLPRRRDRGRRLLGGFTLDLEDLGGGEPGRDSRGGGGARAAGLGQGGGVTPTVPSQITAVRWMI
jgi:hypothetical protein